MLPLSKKVKVLNLIRKEKKSYTEVAEIKFATHEIVKKKKKKSMLICQERDHIHIPFITVYTIVSIFIVSCCC